MASDQSNALAELAEDLEHDNFFGCDHFKRELWVDKAHRIIAELAKVKPVYNVYTNEPCWPTAGQACDALMACRAIAEE